MCSEEVVMRTLRESWKRGQRRMGCGGMGEKKPLKIMEARAEKDGMWRDG